MNSSQGLADPRDSGRALRGIEELLSMAPQMTTCPGCGLEMPPGEEVYDRKFHASAECWSVYEEVLAREFQDAVLFGQVHQLTVDAYCVQHAGGQHPDQSVGIHLMGLYLVHERGLASLDVLPRLRGRASCAQWPHLVPPDERASLTVADVALADSSQMHAVLVREWAAEVWRVWSPHHEVARDLAEGLVYSRQEP